VLEMEASTLLKQMETIGVGWEVGSKKRKKSAERRSMVLGGRSKSR